MGSCTSSNRRSRNRLSRTNLTAEHLYQSIFLQRLSNFRNYSPYSLNALIDETLLMIRTVVDNDQEPPHAMFLVSRIANREDRWLDVICALIERIPIDDPLGATVIALLLDECSPPSDESMQQLIKRMCSNNRARVKFLQTILDDYIKQMAPNSTQTQISEQQLVTSSANSDKTTNKNQTSLSLISPQRIDDDLHRDRNTLVVFACLAEKLGPTSKSMLSGIGLEFLIDRVYLGIYNYNQLEAIVHENRTSRYNSILKIILFALVAVEKCSHTSELKYILLQSLTIEQAQLKTNILQYYETWSRSTHCLQRQIGFYAQWLLDNIFILEDRRPSYETIDHHYINVMLNDKDVSEYLKIGPDGLEARSDSVSFESVRCTYAVSSGVWYYEVLIITDGVMQIGWATKQSKFLNHEGYGIGDDQYSIAYDGCRNLIWFDAKSITHTNQSWKSGDILGCLIDFERREVIFSLNGQALDPFRKIFSSSNSNITGFFAAASFMSYQQCRFNFGLTPFRYPPRHVGNFQTFNHHGYLTDEEKLILPKYKKLEFLRSIKLDENDCILCVDLRSNTVLKPCQHRGFCHVCAAKLENCPICRSSIRERTICES